MRSELQALVSVKGLKISCRDDVRSGTADILDDDISDMHGRVNDNAVQRAHDFEHFLLGDRLTGFDRQTAETTTFQLYRRRDHPDGMRQFVAAVFFAAGTGIAADFQRFFIHGQMTAFRAGNADDLSHGYASSIAIVISSPALSSRTRGRMIFSISPGARRSRLNPAIRVSPLIT